jgi:DNA polymerase III subunit gamma/tau
MSYLVLARKWRPQCFEDLVGQEHVGRTLSNAITQGRIHHAYLFSGPRGVGKTSAARILAKALNCEKGLSPVPCNECRSCEEITKGLGVDVFEIDGASNTGVDDIRDLRENVRYLPTHSRFKIFIIDEVHMLSLNAFNALLKVLEEPPEHAKFLFATTEPHKIPPTILSRCQRFDFRKISTAGITTLLKTIAEKENLHISPLSLGLIASQAEGGMRDALSTLDQIVAYCGENVEDGDVQALLGMIDRRLIFETASGLLERDGGKVIDTLQQVDEMGFAIRQFCKDLIETFRSLIHIKIFKGSRNIPSALQEESDILTQLAKQGSLEDLQRDLTLLLKVEKELPLTSLPLIMLETALLRMVHLPPAEALSGLLERLENLEKNLGGGLTPSRPGSNPVAKTDPEQLATTPVEEKTQEKKKVDHEDAWKDFLSHLSSKHPFISSYLKPGRLLLLDLPEVQLGFPEGSYEFKQLLDPENRKTLEDAASEAFSQKISLSMVPLPAEQFKEEPDRNALQEQKLKEEALNHPAVKAVLKVFGGETEEVKAIEPSREEDFVEKER